ncbi:CDP-alcohol phosphatidyltransferase family protein [Zooshikella ganghwensis]|uniref:CDP-alcohol phosphatidyltransferase family protein n=1 Tax=Zooshikella ganghwensis TaxID=202772 RepID=A0A4P9VIZ7_9GAMM|nr:CDP-alcohol phosphatidyltransferase family protein [Zooshikella ganghwensis]RDH43228.1 CDP-alcohol phosphatidyltransferase family protein [Zooshikella ganghwensis]
MLDRWTSRWIQPPLTNMAQIIAPYCTANQVTVAGFLLGMLVLPLLAYELYWSALFFILLNRCLDGLDGALARISQPTDSGSFLDITLDFIFYAAVVFGFALARPEENGLYAALLLFGFMGTGASFLAFAVLAKKYQLTNPHFPHKSLFYLNGLTEGTETILFFVLFCVFPNNFPMLASTFAVLCLLTVINRIIVGYFTLKRCEQ